MCLEPNQEEVVIKERIPLCIDLDGTLIKNDIFWESLRALLKKNVFYLLVLPIWLLKGKAFVKGQVSQRVSLNIVALPYHDLLLNYILSERKTGRNVVLATGTHYRIATKIAKHLNCFDQVLASSDFDNLTGKRKSRVLVKRYGKRGFDYAGNSRVDLPIWENANSAIIVSGSRNLIEAVKKVSRVETIFS
ncbi:MAG: hypothetical protein NPIRA01_05880 [Nitrospirales bacterium]|nr:MAG: hypothetical protein NPIRA01_05880 [Nitrospirales bacterium]